MSTGGFRVVMLAGYGSRRFRIEKPVIAAAAAVGG